MKGIDCMSTGNVITMQMWNDAGSFRDIAAPGDSVEESIVDEFLGCVPPVSHSYGYIQCGEPYGGAWDEEKEKWRQTFYTFSMNGSQWIYNGLCFAGGTDDMSSKLISVYTPDRC